MSWSFTTAAFSCLRVGSGLSTLTSLRFLTVYPSGRVPCFSIRIGQRWQRGRESQHFFLGSLDGLADCESSNTTEHRESRPMENATSATVGTEGLHLPKGPRTSSFVVMGRHTGPFPGLYAPYGPYH